MPKIQLNPDADSATNQPKVAEVQVASLDEEGSTPSLAPRCLHSRLCTAYPCVEVSFMALLCRLTHTSDVSPSIRNYLYLNW